jgi:hypothetical protein
MKTLSQPVNPQKMTSSMRRPGVLSSTELMAEMRSDNRWDGSAWLLLSICAVAILCLCL